MSRTLGVALATIVIATPAFAQEMRPRDHVYYDPVPAGSAPTPVSSNTIFLNRCASNCSVQNNGTDDGTVDPASSVIAQGTLQAFAAGDANWNAVVACVRDLFA